ncbi:hypothetical protein HK098_008248 [Nowakowskiella sp. JEL0407]|nr:hypothetical protein HK098_008248 [Nowakowskiella sp. JEL0407]
MEPLSSKKVLLEDLPPEIIENIILFLLNFPKSIVRLRSCSKYLCTVSTPLSFSEIELFGRNATKLKCENRPIEPTILSHVKHLNMSLAYDLSNKTELIFNALKNLESIRICGNSESMKYLKVLANFISTSLGFNHVTALHLNLWENGFSADIGKICNTLKRMQSFTLEFDHIRTVGDALFYHALASMTELKKFKIVRKSARSDVHATKKKMKELLETLKLVPNLCELSIHNINLSRTHCNSAFCELVSSGKLSKLELADTQLDVNIFESIGRSSRLEDVIIKSSTQLKGLECLFSNPNLFQPDSLILEGSLRFTDEDFSPDLSKMKFVSLSFVGSDWWAVRNGSITTKLISGIGESEVLESLTVEVCSSISINALINLVNSCRKLRHLGIIVRKETENSLFMDIFDLCRTIFNSESSSVTEFELRTVSSEFYIHENLLYLLSCNNCIERMTIGIEKIPDLVKILDADSENLNSPLTHLDIFVSGQSRWSETTNSKKLFELTRYVGKRWKMRVLRSENKDCRETIVFFVNYRIVGHRNIHCLEFHVDERAAIESQVKTFLSPQYNDYNDLRSGLRDGCYMIWFSS